MVAVVVVASIKARAATSLPPLLWAVGPHKGAPSSPEKGVGAPLGGSSFPTPFEPLRGEESGTKMSLEYIGIVAERLGYGLHLVLAYLMSLYQRDRQERQGKGSVLKLIILQVYLGVPSRYLSLVQILYLGRRGLMDSQRPSRLAPESEAHHVVCPYASAKGAAVSTPKLVNALRLSHRPPPPPSSGLLILNAHLLSDTSTEAFIARVFRAAHPSAFLRAFTDNAPSMVAGFGKVERLMRCFGSRRLLLWPRFQLYVAEELERDPPLVIDVRVPMTRAMRGIQAAIVEVMGACLGEMRNTNKVDVDELTLENGLFKSFDEIVRRQLDPIWHTLGRKTKQLVSDLRNLRKLLDYLIRYDAVTYLRYLDTLRVSEGVRSIWMFADSSHKIFDLAKKRVYRLVHSVGGKLDGNDKRMVGKKRKAEKDHDVDKRESRANSDISLDEVLEESPKWRILREILHEIEEERRKKALPAEGGDEVLDVEVENDTVLVACKDERSCMQLEDCLKKGAHQVMQEEWGNYLLSKAELHGLQKQNKKKRRDPKGFGVLNGVVPPMPRENADATSINKLEHNALLAAALERRNMDKEMTGNSVELDAPSEKPGKLKGKSKMAKENKTRKAKNAKGRQQVNNLQVSGSENEAHNDESTSEGISASTVAKGFQKYNQEVSASEPVPNKPIPSVHFYALERGYDILDILRPSIIIVYHPDIAFVREIEVYKSENPSKKLKVYFLFYEDSTEIQKFEASIRRENGAFESLIRQKSSMMIPNDQPERLLYLIYYFVFGTLTNSSTRKAGGRKEAEKEMQVIVDMREFMSSLPNVLHLKGMRIIPVTLEVGDYVLSPLICVERKSISDLFQSFASGRLYHQVEVMSRYYKIPVLLIEFSQDKSFSFQSASDLGDDVTPTSIISKLSLLVLHFPRLRLVWSRSLHATAEIFALLKANQDEPDEIKAVRVGVPSDEGVVENDVRAENYNTSAIEFLRRLPGVTDANYRALMDGCDSLAELALLPEERLAGLMGSKNAARTLRDFLDAKCPAML
ncbi:hypothetical protein Sjap_004778 [Stephania japonica]|uniref:ERCC4 domain-containing protein n=1 Tax=Stephania japonica TaxID=461633 RepID=A0AAP0K3V0_9MAGN